LLSLKSSLELRNSPSRIEAI